MLEVPKLSRDLNVDLTSAFPKIYEKVRVQGIKEGFSKHEIRSLKLCRNIGSVTLLSAGHIQHFLRNHNIQPNQNTLDDLADFLEDELPHSFDTPVTVTTLPTNVKEVRSKRILVLGEHEQFDEERLITRNLIERYFDADEEYQWPASHFPNGCEFAQTAHSWSDDIMDLTQQVIETNAHMLPTTLSYQPIVIDMMKSDLQGMENPS